MAISAEALKILQPCTVTWLHVGNGSQGVMNLNARLSVLSSVVLNWIFATALAEKLPLVLPSKFSLLCFPHTR